MLTGNEPSCVPYLIVVGDSSGAEGAAGAAGAAVGYSSGADGAAAAAVGDSSGADVAGPDHQRDNKQQ